MPPSLVLASASPRRADLLRAAGIAFEICSTSVDETRAVRESPRDYVLRVAAAKGRWAAARMIDRAIVSADTVVVVDGEVLGKPRDAADAQRMLGMLSGRAHTVLTGVCLTAPGLEPDELEVGAKRGGGSGTRCALESTTVEFAALTPGDIDWYVATGEPLDKAGAYAIQGLASRFVMRIDGSYSNVVGLPVALVCRLCNEAGILLS
jgi:septum formation protein